MGCRANRTRIGTASWLCCIALLLPPLLALASNPAFAQVRGLGGVGVPGSLGGALGGVGGVGGSASGIGGGAPGAGGGGTLIGPTFNIPLGGSPPSLPGTDTITNTVPGAASTATSLPRGTTDGLTKSVGQAARPNGLPGQQRRSGVPPVGERRFVSDEVIVRLPSSLPARALDEFAQRHGLTRLESYRIDLIGITSHRWRIGGGRSVPDVIRALEAEGAVTAAQPNYKFTLAQRPTSDYRYAQYAPAKLGLPEAHRIATGDGVLIAVIDSGIDVSHPELTGSIAAQFDAVGSNEAPHSHGTGMAGAIIAHARLQGVAPSSRILAIRAFSASATSAEGTTLALLRAIDWAVANGARVINMSFVGPFDPEIALALSAARRKGVVLVAAAGNGGSKAPTAFPGSDANVIAVTATDGEDHLFNQASRGNYIAVAAPGVEILAPSARGEYQISTGTSVAAAHVSGVVALLLERNPSLAPDAVRKVLTSSARDLGPKGKDDQFGAGLVKVYRALRSLDTPVAFSPTTKANTSAMRKAE